MSRELLGPAEVAALLNVKRSTVMVWVRRGVAPSPKTTIDGRPVWNKDTIVRWARSTGRLSL